MEDGRHSDLSTYFKAKRCNHLQRVMTKERRIEPLLIGVNLSDGFLLLS